MFLRESNKIACLEAENAKLRDLALKLTSQVRVLREALRDVPSENCRNQRPQVWERWFRPADWIDGKDETRRARRSGRAPTAAQLGTRRAIQAGNGGGRIHRDNAQHETGHESAS